MSDSQGKSRHVSLEEFRELFEEIDDIIVIVNKDGLIEYVNRALRKKLGYKTKRYTGRNITDCGLFDPSLKAADIIKKIFSEQSFISLARGGDGQTHDLSWKTKIFTHQKQRRALATIRDISDQLNLQRKVEKYTQNLQEMVFQRTQQIEKEKQKALELHQAKAVFLSRMSHEMRTPLTAIRGYAEMLKEHEGPAQERNKHLRTIERNAERLLEMINETLDMVKLEQDKYQIHEQPFHLRSCVQEVIDTYTILAEEKGLGLEYSMKEDIPEIVYSDPSAISQILTNLIGNAIKFTQEGKIRVRIKQRFFPGKITKKLYFYVEDTGIGIPEDSHGRIFKSFEQYLDNQEVHHKGSGLGLAISRQLARLLGGQVKLISSQPGKGSTFVFSLPIRNAPLKKA